MLAFEYAFVHKLRALRQRSTIDGQGRAVRMHSKHVHHNNYAVTICGRHVYAYMRKGGRSRAYVMRILGVVELLSTIRHKLVRSSIC